MWWILAAILAGAGVCMLLVLLCMAWAEERSWKKVQRSESSSGGGYGMDILEEIENPLPEPPAPSVPPEVQRIIDKEDYGRVLFWDEGGKKELLEAWRYTPEGDEIQIWPPREKSE